MVYYNEWEAFPAAWIRELIHLGELPAGIVDQTDIRKVKPDDITSKEAHFFAGIGGWPYALKLAGWPQGKAVWTASCPCQPFSNAGKRKGVNDDRHLWPVFRDLVAECKPATIFGEQVASNDGREWLAGVRLDLEKLGYAVGAADLCAAGVGAPQRRQRLFWVGYSRSIDKRKKHEVFNGHQSFSTNGSKRNDAFHPWRNSRTIRIQRGQSVRTSRGESGTFPLAPRVSSRMERGRQASEIKGYGNAICPQVAATFIRAFMDAT